MRGNTSWIFRACVLLAGLSLSGCFGFAGDLQVSSSAVCDKLPASFENKVWNPLASQRCITCHNTEGQASGSRLVLMEGDTQEAMARNLAIFSSLARVQQDGQPLLLLKPTGRVPHVGGLQLSEDSAEYRNLAIFLGEVNACEEECAPKPIPVRVRRLNRDELNATWQVLVGDTSKPANALPVDDRVNGYTNDAAALRVSPLFAEQLFTTAETLAAGARSRGITQNTGCSVAQRGEATCAQEFIRTFATKAFRRPATQVELDGLFKVYQDGRTDGSYAEGLEWVVTAVVQSGSFLYNTELGAPGPAGNRRLQPYELASALSYLVTGAPPDAALLDAAANNQLGQEAIAQQVTRLLARPEAKTQLNRFFFQWLQLDGLDALEKDSGEHPTFNATLRQSMKVETESFLSSVLFSGEKNLKSVFTDTRATLTSSMAELYGVTGTGNVALDPKERAGILTRASVLATFAQQAESSPIRRGKLVRTRVLCQALPPPPKDLMIVFPVAQPTKTTRERYAQHATDPACLGCHRLMDPVGFGFESYDAIGGFRAQENGLNIDASGELLATRDVNGPFNGAVELSRKLADSEEVQECFARHLMEFSYARPVEAGDECSVAPARDRFVSSGTNIADLLIHYATSDTFQIRSEE
jgi:hypothetical protein